MSDLPESRLPVSFPLHKQAGRKRKRQAEQRPLFLRESATVRSEVAEESEGSDDEDSEWWFEHTQLFSLATPSTTPSQASEASANNDYVPKPLVPLPEKRQEHADLVLELLPSGWRIGSGTTDLSQAQARPYSGTDHESFFWSIDNGVVPFLLMRYILQHQLTRRRTVSMLINDKRTDPFTQRQVNLALLRDPTVFSLFDQLNAHAALHHRPVTERELIELESRIVFALNQPDELALDPSARLPMPWYERVNSDKTGGVPTWVVNERCIYSLGSPRHFQWMDLQFGQPVLDQEPPDYDYSIIAHTLKPRSLVPVPARPKPINGKPPPSSHQATASMQAMMDPMKASKPPQQSSRPTPRNRALSTSLPQQPPRPVLSLPPQSPLFMSCTQQARSRMPADVQALIQRTADRMDPLAKQNIPVAQNVPLPQFTRSAKACSQGVMGKWRMAMTEVLGRNSQLHTNPPQISLPPLQDPLTLMSSDRPFTPLASPAPPSSPSLLCLKDPLLDCFLEAPTDARLPHLSLRSPGPQPELKVQLQSP